MEEGPLEWKENSIEEHLALSSYTLLFSFGIVSLNRHIFVQSVKREGVRVGEMSCLSAPKDTVPIIERDSGNAKLLCWGNGDVRYWESIWNTDWSRGFNDIRSTDDARSISTVF